jgi:hypothetical protein
MKWLIYSAGIAAMILTSGCVYHHHRGGTYDHYERSSGYYRWQPSDGHYRYYHHRYNYDDGHRH